MNFATYTYALFLAATFAVHWLLPARFRPWLLILASYVFYATWRWPYVALLALLALFNWAYARFGLARGLPLWPGIATNLGILLYFKYTNFLVQAGGAAVRAFGGTWTPAPLDILLPLGVSFFTFQGIAYLVDVASGDKAFHRLRDFMLYKAFWPQLIAGPIIRPEEIREQIETPRTIGYADISEGCRRILQGAFKKVVIADNLAPQVELAFLAQGTPHVLDTLAGVVGFGLQIYFDFSAYSDFAIGSARLFGFRFPENFNWPYAARTPQEFWNRWHMSLSRWIRDYVFTPLTFATRGQPQLRMFWLVVAMALCGLWHGAAWTFVLWGAWHGMFLVLQQTLLAPLFSSRARPLVALSWLSTLVIVFGGWLLFRAPTLENAVSHLQAVITLHGGLLRPALIRENGVLVIGVIAASTLVVTLFHEQIESGWRRCQQFRLLTPWLRPSLYALQLVAVIVLDQEAQAFVYFQF